MRKVPLVRTVMVSERTATSNRSPPAPHASARGRQRRVRGPTRAFPGAWAQKTPGPARRGRAANRRGRGGLNDAQKKMMDDAIAVLKEEGAVIVDPADIPSVVDKDPANNFLRGGQGSGGNNAKGRGEGWSVGLK